MIVLPELAPAWTYMRPDGTKVFCWGVISDSPHFTFELVDANHCHRILEVPFSLTISEGNIIKTWRSWTKFFNKYSCYANEIISITAKERA